MIGTTISHYKILEKLGEGGMGVVYKAEDTTLDRFVALKFLPEHVSASADELQRFVQEAKAAAALNHPNICTIYGIEQSEGKNFIVMEFVEGQTLQEKKSSLSMKQAIDIGIQIAEGLAAAHEKGIVHRDIKPENIMIRKDGRAQIMDFGLAKLRGASRLTKEGSTVGTAGYMSPEQVQGQDTDHRSDIFSLGVLLFEMMTKQLPFKAAHETAIAYEIVNVDSPPMTSINPEIAPELDAIVLECLEKDPKERTQSAGQVALDLKKYRRESSRQRASRIVSAVSVQAARGTPGQPESSPVTTRSGLSARSWVAIAVVAVVVIATAALLRFWKTESSNFTEPVEFSFDIPGKSSQILNWEYVLEVSPDGKTIAYTDLSKSASAIYVRKLESDQSSLVRGTEGGLDPVFENDNWLSFTINRNLARIPLTGGVPEISQFAPNVVNGVSWTKKGEIVLANYWPSGLTYQHDWNSQQEVLSEIDPSKNEGTLMLPYALPGDKAALFTIWSKDGTFDDSKIAVVDLKTKKRKNLLYNGVDLLGTSPRFVQPPWGNYLLWSRNSDLYAASFDLSADEVTGLPIDILHGIAVNAASGKAAYSVTNANNGTIVYMPGRLDTAQSNLVWINKEGKRTTTLATGPYLMPSISRDGKALVILQGPVYKIGLLNLRSGKVEMLFAKGDNDIPKITPDGSSFVFVSNFEDGKYNAYLSRLDGIGGVRKIVATEGGYPDISNLSPDGRYILYDRDPAVDSSRMWIKDITGSQAPKLLIDTKAKITSPAFSPDGKFIAYRSNEIGGQFRLFIRPFPINTTKVQVSVGDGRFAQWSVDGTELFYRTKETIVAARIQRLPELKVLSRRIVYGPLPSTDQALQPGFALAPDGRILLQEDAVDESKPVKVKVIVNWFTELKEKLAESK